MYILSADRRGRILGPMLAVKEWTGGGANDANEAKKTGAGWSLDWRSNQLGILQTARRPSNIHTVLPMSVRGQIGNFVTLVQRRMVL